MLAYNMEHVTRLSLLPSLLLCFLRLSHSVDASAGQSAANARKRFTLQGLSNRRSLQAGNSDHHHHWHLGQHHRPHVLFICYCCHHHLHHHDITIITPNSRGIYLASVLSSSISIFQSHITAVVLFFFFLKCYRFLCRRASRCCLSQRPAACQHNKGHISLCSPFSAFICSRQYPVPSARVTTRKL